MHAAQVKPAMLSNAMSAEEGAECYRVDRHYFIASSVRVVDKAPSIAYHHLNSFCGDYPQLLEYY